MTRTRLFTCVHAFALSALVWLSLLGSSPVLTCTVGGSGGSSGCGVS